MAEIKYIICDCCGAKIDDFWAVQVVKMVGGQKCADNKNFFFRIDLCDSCKQKRIQSLQLAERKPPEHKSPRR